MLIKFLITGGCGFIGSALIRCILQQKEAQVLNLDKLTYASNQANLELLEGSERYKFIRGDVCDHKQLELVFEEYQPDIVMHLAAETHVDKSIREPFSFVRNNVLGTVSILDVAGHYWLSLKNQKKDRFRFHHISTDEVYGDLPHPDDSPSEIRQLKFTEETPYKPSSPYSASKASSDHFVRAWHRTYGLPILISNCSNNYGPYQFPEKLIPLTISKALANQNIPIYGSGNQIRDWLYVSDHARALYLIATQGSVGHTYNIGGENEIKNIDLVNQICSILNEKVKFNKDFRRLITHVEDRQGHDCRYAIDNAKIRSELNWEPMETFETGLRKTVMWYLKNQNWLETTRLRCNFNELHGLK